MAKPDPWADKPDRFDRADREWATRWADEAPLDEASLDDAQAAPLGPGYENREVTPEVVRDSYGRGMTAAGPHLGFGMQLAAGMLFFVGAGIVADRWLGTTPWGVLIGASLGMVGILWMVVRFARQAEDSKKRGPAGR